MNSEYLFDAVMARLKAAVSVHSDGQLAESLGLSGSAYANLKKRGSIPYEKAIALAISHKVNLHWLFTGEYEQWKEQMTSSSMPLHDPRAEKLIGLLPSLTERQFNQVEWAIEDFQTMNRLITEVEAFTVSNK